MNLLRSSFPAAPKRLHFATWAHVAGFGLMTALAFMAVYPEQSLRSHLERSAQTDNISIAYLSAWLRAKPDDHHLRLLLAQRFFEKGEIRQSQQTLLPLLRVSGVKAPILTKSNILLLDILERLMWEYEPDSPAFRQAQHDYLQQMRKVIPYQWPADKREQFADKALAFGDQKLAVQLYSELIRTAPTVKLAWFDHVAQINLAERQYRAAAGMFFQAIAHSHDLAQKRNYFLLGVRTLQSGNLMTDAINAAQTHASGLIEDPGLLSYLAKLALASNRPDLAERYVSLLLKQRITHPIAGLSP